MKKYRIPILAVTLASLVAWSSPSAEAQRGDRGGRSMQRSSGNRGPAGRPSASRPSMNRSSPGRSMNRATPNRGAVQRPSAQRSNTNRPNINRSRPSAGPAQRVDRSPSFRPSPSPRNNPPRISSGRDVRSMPGATSRSPNPRNASPRNSIERIQTARPGDGRPSGNQVRTPRENRPDVPRTMDRSRDQFRQNQNPVRDRVTTPRGNDVNRGGDRPGPRTLERQPSGRESSDQTRERLQRNLDQFRQRNPSFTDRPSRPDDRGGRIDRNVERRPQPDSPRFNSRDNQIPDRIRDRDQPDRGPRERPDLGRRPGEGTNRVPRDLDRSRDSDRFSNEMRDRFRDRPDFGRDGRGPREDFRGRGEGRGDGRGVADGPRRPPMDRITTRGDYFTRDRHNQSLNYLRLRNSDMLDRVARGGNYRDLFHDSQRYRVRPIHHNHHVNIRHRYRLPFNVRSPRYYRVANRMVWWRGMHLGGYRYDPMRHYYRNYRGHVIGVYYWNLFRPHYRFVVPHYNQYYRGSYYADAGNYYYYPDTYVSPEAFSAGSVSENPPQAVQMEYGAFAHTEDLSYRFERLVNDLCLDMHYNYQQNPDFDEVYREAYDLLNIAKDILASAEQGNQADVAEQLFGLDQFYYHLLDQIADWDRTEQKPIGEHDLLTKLSLVEATMQHLMYDSGVEPSFEVVDDSVPEDPESAGSGAPMIEFPQLP